MNGLTNSEIFSEIYEKRLWGELADSEEKFFSGNGSHNEKIIVPYVNTLIPLLTNNNIRNIVDLGCGDFWIMRHVLTALAERKYNFFYTGVDVVKDLIRYNHERFGRKNVRFICRDVTQENEDLPDGDILIVRQVLQHLSNADIKKILSKTDKFKFLFITEHICDAFDAVYNIDKSPGADIRSDCKSGVYLEHAPFNIKNIVHLLKLPYVFSPDSAIRSSLIIKGGD